MLEKMEKRYHINIEDDSYYHPLTKRYVKQYNIYTADGCSWEKGLSYRGLIAECKKYEAAFLDIFRKVGAATSNRI